MSYADLIEILNRNLEGVSESDLRQKLEDTIDRLRQQHGFSEGKRRRAKKKPTKAVIDRADAVMTRYGE